MYPDPTTDFIDRMNDPSRWKIRRGVPIFKPHERAVPEQWLPTGQRVPAHTIRVTEADLPVIAAEMASLEARGEFGIVTPGHINRAPGTPETQQPPVWGYYRNPQVGTFGPDREPAILVDEYLYPEFAAEREQYPYRSADFYPQVRQIFGYALLKRRPALNLGVVAEYQDRGPCYHYAMGDEEMSNPCPLPSYHEAVVEYMYGHPGTSYAAACQHIQATGRPVSVLPAGRPGGGAGQRPTSPPPPATEPASPWDTPAYHDQAVAYMFDNPGMSYEQACIHVVGSCPWRA